MPPFDPTSPEAMVRALIQNPMPEGKQNPADYLNPLGPAPMLPNGPMLGPPAPVNPVNSILDRAAAMTAAKALANSTRAKATRGSGNLKQDQPQQSFGEALRAQRLKP